MSNSGEEFPNYIDDRQMVDVVGITGLAGSGKSYMTKVAARRANFTPVALANPFKVEEVVHSDLPVSQVFGREDKDERVRHRLQIRGTEEGRDVHGKWVWMHFAEAHMCYHRSLGEDKFVISDVRFPNEAEWVRSFNGKIYRIAGRGGETGEQAEHRSEKRIEDIDPDRTVDNSPHREWEAVNDMLRYLEEDFPNV